MAKRGGFPGGGMPGNMANLMKQAQKLSLIHICAALFPGVPQANAVYCGHRPGSGRFRCCSYSRLGSR